MLDDDDDIARRLDAMPEIAPPADFRERVMDAVEDRRPRLSGQAGRLSSTRRYTFAALWAAAAAVVFGFLIITHQRMSDTTATMAPPKASIAVTKAGDLYAIEAVVDRRPQSVSIEIDPSAAEIVGVLDKKDASFGKTKVEFTLRGPSDRAAVVVRPRPGAIATAVVVSFGSTEVVREVVSLR